MIKVILVTIMICLSSFCVKAEKYGDDEEFQPSQEWVDRFNDWEDKVRAQYVDQLAEAMQGCCEIVEFKPTKTYTDLVDHVEFFTKNYARDYYKKLFSKAERHPIHGIYKPIATAIIKQNNGGKIQANMLVDLVSANPYNKDDSRPFYTITFMAKLFNSKVGDKSLKPLNNDIQYIKAVVKCNTESKQLKIYDLWNGDVMDENGYAQSKLKFYIDEKYLINYNCAYIDALNKSGY